MKGMLVLAGIALVSVFGGTAQAAKPGQLDRSFGENGKATGTFCDHERDFAVALDRHHRIVVAGTQGFLGGFCLARYLPNGTLDRSFGDQGSIVTRFGSRSGANSLAIDSRGRILAGGVSQNDLAVARYTPNGSLDTSFGSGGIATTSFGPLSRAQSVAIDSHDRPVAVGWFTSATSTPGFAVARFKQNGDPDPSFGSGGKTTTDFGVDTFAMANSVKIDQEGRIVAGGELDDPRHDFAAARYLTNGSPDDSFSGDGRVTTNVTGNDVGRSVAIDDRGRILLGGAAGPGGAPGHFAILRYRINGSLDSSFGDGGLAKARFKDRAGANSIGIDSKGRIVATGGGFDVARFRTNGKPDNSFSGNGKASADWNALANSLAIDQRDRIDVVGWHSHLVLGRFIG